MLIIRFARRGRKGQAFFDLVVAEKARPVKKKIVEKLGHFNPLSEGGKGDLTYDKSLVEKYIKNGAQVSQSAARLLVKNDCEMAGKFIEARVTKPKKTEAPTKEEAPAEEKSEEATETSDTDAVKDKEAEAPAEEVAEEKKEESPDAKATEDKKSE